MLSKEKSEQQLVGKWCWHLRKSEIHTHSVSGHFKRHFRLFVPFSGTKVLKTIQTRRPWWISYGGAIWVIWWFLTLALLTSICIKSLPPPSYATFFRELKQLLDFRFGHIKSPPPQSPRELVDSEGYRLVSFSSCEKCCGFWWLLVQWV